MAGIASYGAYIPYYRLSRAEIAKAWGNAAGPGERAVASYDEDSLTMAVAAARDCLTGIDRASIGGLYFASTTAPYREKQSAALIAAVLGLAPEAATMDFSGSLRCGTNALQGGPGRGGERLGAEHPGVRRGYPSRLSLRACRDELRRRRRGSARERRRDHRRGQTVRDQVLRDPGHLALGQGHVRPFGRRPLRHGRGLRSRDEGERVGHAEEARSGTGRHRACGAQFAQRPPAACPRAEAGL